MTTLKEPTTTIENPVLKGFNPDPSILRVGDDYYIATSTFEWFPGVQIHHSKDLVNWSLKTRPLDETRLLDMQGNPDSGGIWAPCLSYSDGLFYLIYTNVRSWDEGPYKISYNYLTTASDINGPWSDPVFLTASGFDPSLFHDDDGRKWLVSMIWDHRQGKNNFAGILLQEYDPKAKALVGPVKNIFKGTEIGLVEGPHLYKKNGYYYLLTAEGGTQYEHAASLARSRNIDGPYEIHPQNPILTSNGEKAAILQKAGHGSFVETADGEWYLAHLCGRPIDGTHCILGRETAIQKCKWREDNWIELEHGNSTPVTSVSAPTHSVASQPSTTATETIHFDSDTLDINFQTLRRPFSSEWMSLDARPGWLRLLGQEPTISLHKQSLIARRIQAFNIEAETCLEFNPRDFQQMAGLIAYYDTRNHYYLRISRDEEAGRSLNIIRCDQGETTEVLDSDISIPEENAVYLKAVLETTSIQFSYSTNGSDWTPIGPALPSKILSDEYQTLRFTGAFIGMCAQDISGGNLPADFKYFKYIER